MPSATVLDCTLTDSLPDSPPSSLASGAPVISGPHTRELLQSAKQAVVIVLRLRRIRRLASRKA